MIHFVTTRSHSYTVKNVVARHGRSRCRQWTYERLFQVKSIPLGTWIFTDHERLSDYEITRAAGIATKLENEGARVVNHPALVRSRYEFLRRLKDAGINSFSAMRCESGPRPSRFPVFIRNAYDHRSRGFALINDQEQLDAELQRMEQRGVPMNGKLVIEYAGEEVVPDVWARLSSYCVGDRIIAHHMAFDHSWIVKHGFCKETMENHAERERLLMLERDFITRNLYAGDIAGAFAVARIEYGRADFSIVNGRLEIYEINTNPNHGSFPGVLQETHPRRRAVQKQSEDELQKAIVSLDRAGIGRAELGPSLINRVKRRCREGVRAAWRP